MSEYDHHDDERRKEKPPEASVHVAKWSPWIWVVPALAIFFVGYLIVRYGFFGGGDITVRFSDARGLDRYSPVRFRGAKVGTVQKITIDDKSRAVVVRISMDASMKVVGSRGRTSSRSLPVMMRETSRRSSTSCCCERALRSMILTA